MPEKMSFPSVFYIDRQEISYLSAKSSDLITINLTLEVSQDLTIMSEPALERILITWIDQAKITPSQTLLVLSDQVTFSLDINELTATESEPEVKAFTELLPFNNIVSKVFALENKARVTAVNHAFLLPIKAVLERLGFNVLCITPAYVLGITKENPFSKEVAKKTLEMAELLFKYNFINDAEVTAKLHEPQPFLSVKIDTKIIVMAVIFVVLLVVLGVLLWMQQRAS